MSDQDRNDAGEFVSSSAEPLTGLQSEEARFDYTQMPEPAKADDVDEVPTREQFDAVWQQDESATATPIVYFDKQTMERLNDDPREGPVETVTLERASRDLASHHALEADGRAASVSADFAAEVDALRAEFLKENPGAEKELGIEKPEELAIPNSKKSTDQGAQLTPDGLDPEVAKALQHPQVRQAIEQELSETTKVRESYSAGLNQADAMTRATFMSEIPELSGLQPAQFEQGLAMLQQVDPPRFQKAMNLLGRFNQIQTAQAQDQQQRAYVQQQSFVNNVQKEDARLAEMVGKAAASEANQAVRDYLSDHGITDGRQMVHLIQQNPVLASAEGRKTILEAAKYRQMMSAPRPRASQPVPTVQRPGVASQSRVSSGDAEIQALDRELTRTGSLKTAAKLMAARAARK